MNTPGECSRFDCCRYNNPRKCSSDSQCDRIGLRELAIESIKIETSIEDFQKSTLLPTLQNVSEQINHTEKVFMTALTGVNKLSLPELEAQLSEIEDRLIEVEERSTKLLTSAKDGVMVIQGTLEIRRVDFTLRIGDQKDGSFGIVFV